MVRNFGILTAVVASLVLGLGATGASAKGGKMGGFGGFHHGGLAIGLAAGVGLGLAALAVRSASYSTCYRQRYVNAYGDVVVRRICE